jgi:asparagine synthase (glutamine-hydrolysing)
MPGLIGIFHKDLEPVDLALFDSMVSSVQHRKIYEKTVEIDNNNRYAIAEIKLPILKNGKQPFISNDGKVKILMHGEIYNEGIDELSQLKYIYDLYQTFDLKFPERLNGSFVIFLLDELNGRVIIANDRTASRPLLYFIDGRVLYCAPELKALLRLTSVKKKLNLSAVASFLSCGYFLDSETWVDDVKSLDNATVLVFTEEGAKFIKYWNFVFDEDAKDLGIEHYQKILAELILSSVRNRIRTIHKYGILLSGGYDSRGILGCVLRERGPEEIKTISWGSSKGTYDSDCAVAERLAKKFGLHHTFHKLESEELTQHIKDFVYLSDGATDAFPNYPESLKLHFGHFE